MFGLLKVAGRGCGLLGNGKVIDCFCTFIDDCDDGDDGDDGGDLDGILRSFSSAIR